MLKVGHREKGYGKGLAVAGNVSVKRKCSPIIQTNLIDRAGKRRKVRCQLSSEDVPVCSGCLARGTTCLSQEYPEEHDPSSTPNVGERLGRVEQLLEKLVAKITAYEEEENAQKIQTPESMGNDVLTPYSSNANSNMKDSVPILSLFDNDVVSQCHVWLGGMLIVSDWPSK